MNVGKLKIAPEVTPQFLEVLKKLNQHGTPKQPEKFIRKILGEAKLIETPNVEDFPEDKRDVSYYRGNGCVFEIKNKPSPCLIGIKLSKDIRVDQARRTEIKKLKRLIRSRLCLAKVQFADGVLERLVELFPGPANDDLEVTALTRFATMSEVVSNSEERVHRIIRHGFQEVRYFQREGCRFLVREEDGVFIVFAIEKIVK